MDILEAILGFSMGVVLIGFFCVLFNIKFKNFCKLILFNTLTFIAYVLLVYFNILKYSSLACFVFGAFGAVGFIIPVALIFLN